MKYVIYKANSYLVDLSEWSTTWLNNIAKAFPFSNRDEAVRVAESLGASVITINDYGVN